MPFGWPCPPASTRPALVQLQPKQVDFANKTQEDFEAYRRHQIFLVKTRPVITRTLADPAVGSLDTVKQSEDPVAMLEDSLRVTIAAPEILEITLNGNSIDDLKVILDHLVKRYVDDATAIDRKQIDDELTRTERTRATIQQEIELREKAIEHAARARVSPARTTPPAPSPRSTSGWPTSRASTARWGRRSATWSPHSPC